MDNIITTSPTFISALPCERLHLFATIFLCVLIVALIAILLDLRDGIATARRCGQKLHSHKLRVTVGKIIEYWQFIFLAALADFVGAFMPFYGIPYLTLIFGLAVIIIEAKSMFEHAKRRKSGVTKLPQTVADIVEFVGGADELKELLFDLAKIHLNKKTAKVGDEDDQSSYSAII